MKFNLNNKPIMTAYNKISKITITLLRKGQIAKERKQLKL